MRFSSITRPRTALLVLLLTFLFLLQSPLFAQTTGTVSGVVADETGAVIPKATVVLTNQQNGFTRQTASNGAGYFAFPSVPSSTNYIVKITMEKFRGWQSQPFAVRPGDEINFTNIKMEVSAATQEVTVEATSDALKVLDSGERSDVINSKEMGTLAVVGRNATELIRMLPGMAMDTGDQQVNNKPGYNTAVVGLSSPTGSFSSNGTGTNGISVVLDGASLTDIQSNSGSTQTVNIDMVEEIKVSTSSYGAENAKGPTVVNAIGKAGSSSFHGSLYFHSRDASLNAADAYDKYNGYSSYGRYLYPGGTIGGPLVIPHTNFNKNRDKLFFFFGYENYRQSFQSGTLGSWVPTMAERRGDFSAASLNAELCGARPDGAPNPNALNLMCQTMNYLPNGTAIANGDVNPYRNPSGVALVNWLPLPNANPFTNMSGYNYIQPILQDQNGSLLHSRIDYNFNDNNKVFASYNRQAQIQEYPVNWGGWIPTASTLYPGAVSAGDLSHTFSVNYTRILSSTLTNELNVTLSMVDSPARMDNPLSTSRFHANDYNCLDPVKRAAGTCGSSGFGNFNYLGQFKNGGDYSMPSLSDFSSLGYPNMQMPGGFYNNQVHMKKVVPNIADSVSWVKGEHLLKAGFYLEKGILNGLSTNQAYPQGQLDFSPYSYMWNSAVGQATTFTGCNNPDPAGQQRLSGAAYVGNCINSVAMMYMGEAEAYTQANFSPVVNMQYTTVAGFVTDTWKLRRNLTLTLGARFEHMGPWLDRKGNGLASFSPELYKQQCTGLNGRQCSSDMPGMMWHANNSNVANSVVTLPKMYVSPRFGLSWDIFGKGNTVIRGGWGIYRHQEEFSPYALAASTGQGYKVSHLSRQLTFDSIDSHSPSGIPDFDAYVISPDDDSRPTYYEYNFTISQKMPWNSMLEVAYVGSNSEHLSSGSTSYSDLNLLKPGALFSPAPIHSIPDTQEYGLGPASDIGNMNTAQFDYFRPYPFYQHIYQIDHTFYSSYNSLQASWNKQTGFITFGANYTFSKNLGVAQSYTNLLADPFNIRNDYNPVPYDRTHVVNVHYLVDFGKRFHGGNKFLGYLANGWQVSGISTIQSGPPLASIQGSNLGFANGTIVATEVPDTNMVNTGAHDTCLNRYGFQSTNCITYMNNTLWLGTPDILLMPTVLCDPTKGLAKNQYINPECFGVPALGTNGAYRLPYIHGPKYLNHDLTVLKNFRMGEKRNLQFRLAAFNFLNHPLMSFNKNDSNNLNLSFQNAVPGQALGLRHLVHQDFGIAGIKYGARLIQLSVKFEF